VTPGEFLSVADRQAALASLSGFEFCKLLAELRRHQFATDEARLAATEPAALTALQRFPANEFVLAPALAALLDCAQPAIVVEHLSQYREILAHSPFLMAVFGRVLRLRGSRNSRDVAVRLVDEMKNRELTLAEVQWLNERLDDPFLRVPGYHEPWPQGPQALDRPERFEGVVQVPNLPNYSVRIVQSKTQIERFANRLINCLNSMTDRILSDHTRIIGVERDGHPYEAIEVNPRGGLIRQWKGERNREADPATRGIIERFLLEIGAVRQRRRGGATW